MPKIFAFSLAATACLVCLLPLEAAAQYKNFSIAVDAGAWGIDAPPVVFEPRGGLSADFRQPVRLRRGARLGVENSFKMHSDRWWLSGRINVGFLQFSPNANDDPRQIAYDETAADALGTLIGFELGTHLRYYFLTDHVRPFLQAGISFLRLQSFSSGSGTGIATCGTDPSLDNLCSDTTTSTNFLPHPNLGVFHLQPGLEVFIARDVAIHGVLDLQRWIVLNATDSNALVVAIGLTFYG